MFDPLQVVLVDEIFPKRDIREKHKYGQGANHNRKKLVPSKTGPDTRTGDDGRSGGLDGRHLQRAGGGDGAHASVPGNDCQIILRGAPSIAAEQVLVGAKAILLVGDAAVVEDALLEAGSGAGWHRLEVDWWDLGTCGVEPILREHPVEPVAAPGTEEGVWKGAVARGGNANASAPAVCSRRS